MKTIQAVRNIKRKNGDDDEEDEGGDGEEGDGADDGEDDDDEEGNDDDDDQEVEQDDDKDDDEEGNGDEDLGLNIGGEEGHIKEEEDDELYRDVNINQRRGLQMTQEVKDSHVTLTPVNLDGQQQSSSVSLQFVTSMLNPTLDVGIESIFETTSQLDVQTPTSVALLRISVSTMTSSTIATVTTTSQVPILPTTVSSTIIQNLPNFGLLFRLDDRLRSLEVNFSEAMQTNRFAGAVSAIPEIIHQYMDQRMNKAVKVAVQIQSDRLRDEAQRDNGEFLKTVDENMQKIIKEQVKEQIKVQVSKILPKIEQAVNEQLKAEVLTRSSHSSRTSYVVAADLFEMELKKILIEKMEGNKSIQRSDEQRNLYKALVEAYESDNIILDTYRETTGGQRDAEKEMSLSQQALQRKLLPGALAGLHKGPDLDRRAEDQLIVQSSQQPRWFSQQHKPPSLDRACNKTVPAVDTLTPELLAGHTYELMKGSCKSLVELEYHLEEVFKATTDQLDWVNPEGQQYPHNLLKPLPLIPNYRGRCVFSFEHFINNDLDYLCGGALSRKYTTFIMKTKAADYRHIKWIEYLTPRTIWIKEPIGYDKHALWGVFYWGRKRQQFYGFAVNRESARDVYSKRRIIPVTELKIVEWHSYKHLDWITMRRDDDKLYKFKEGDFKRLRIHDIEYILLLLVQGKLTNLTVEERFAFNGFIYQNKDKRNRLMRIDELHKFSDGTLTDVRTTLDDCLKGIRMQYLPQSIWRKSDKDRAAAMIQAIDKRLKQGGL
nr:hypothetical protein [Tanacetum cinerariifolium]